MENPRLSSKEIHWEIFSSSFLKEKTSKKEIVLCVSEEGTMPLFSLPPHVVYLPKEGGSPAPGPSRSHECFCVPCISLNKCPPPTLVSRDSGGADPDPGVKKLPAQNPSGRFRNGHGT